MKDHPRTCGEKTHFFIWGFFRKGSPPHMRGKGCVTTHHMWTRGITPAHAGKSSVKTVSECRKRDHPRTCGEKTNGSVSHRFQKGSPPHMRGKAFEVRTGKSFTRITPAHAGKSVGMETNFATI